LDNYVYDLYEDSEGIIWIGTRDGLNQFDRYKESFKCYRHKGTDTTSINRGKIFKIVEDKNRNLWITTESGFSRFDRDTETFKNYQIRREETATIKDPYQIFNLCPDKEDNLWICSGNGVYRFNIPSGIIEKMNEVENNFTWEVYEDRSGRCWFCCDGGLFLYNTQEQTYRPFIIQSKKPHQIINQHIRSMLEDGTGNIWIRTLDGIYCYNQGLELTYDLEYSNQYPYTYGYQELTKEFLVDNTGALWFYSPDGINQIIKKGRNFRIYNADTLIATWVNCIHLENNNLIWFGTLQGISSFDRSENVFQLHYGYHWWKSGFPHDAITMYPDRKGTIWVGMWTEGLFSLVQSEDSQRRVRKHLPETVDSTRLNEYGLYAIENIFEDNRGRLWIGERSERFLHYYDRKQNRMIHLVDNPLAEDSLPRRAMIRHQTGSDSLWAIGSSGIYKIIQPLIKVSDYQIIPTNVIKCKLKDDNVFRDDSISVNASYLDSSGNIWLGTNENGLLKMIGKRMPGMEAHEYMVKSYTTSQGLPADKILSIIPDSKGNLWMGTDNGLTKFNISSETFTNYYVRHGLPVNEFRPGSAAISEDGELFFGTIAGMISFYPDSIYINQHLAPVMITDIRIHNQPLQAGKSTELKKSISYSDKILLHHHQDNLSIEYAILNYNNPELNQYRYKLEGFNDDWVYAGNRTNVDFTNVRPGKYTFRVLGSNNDGLWNEDGASLQITIHPPPWRTWYAYLVFGSILVSIILWYRRFLNNRAKLRMAVELERIDKEKLLEMDQMKSRFFANISHEFRTPLTLILGPLEKLEGNISGIIPFKRDLVDAMRRNARRLLHLINQLLDISKLETGKITIQVREGNLGEFVRTIVLSFISLAESKMINYQYYLPETSARVYYDPDKVEKILANLLSNAFKYTPAGGEVSVRMNYLNKENHGPIQSDESGSYQFAEIIISDTGKGIPSDELDRIFDSFYRVSDLDTREEEGTGIGLALTRELVDLYRGEIHVESKVGRGSAFTVKLPVSREQFKEEEITEHAKDQGKDPQTAIIEPDKTLYTDSRDSEPDIRQVPDPDKEVPHILVVEDNADLRNYISVNLGENYQILLAENGKTGLNLSINKIPDLIISDVMMPVMDGMEMCRQIKRDERTNHIPVILLTAKADRDSRMKGLDTGADDYLIKPFDIVELQVRVRNLIEQRRKLREKFMHEFVAKTDKESVYSFQDKLLQKILDTFHKHIPEAEFDIDRMCGELNLSRTQLFNKVRFLTGYTPADLLRTIRLKEAAMLFNSGYKNVTQVMYQVGFNNPSYFARSFRELHKVNPSEYIKSRHI
jgi:signal transduction histidine kinase/DNA-binding response OmpR family regulator/ligand-binding sensor domain-containing protein